MQASLRGVTVPMYSLAADQAVFGLQDGTALNADLLLLNAAYKIVRNRITHLRIATGNSRTP